MVSHGLGELGALHRRNTARALSKCCMLFSPARVVDEATFQGHRHTTRRVLTLRGVMRAPVYSPLLTALSLQTLLFHRNNAHVCNAIARARTGPRALTSVHVRAVDRFTRS